MDTDKYFNNYNDMIKKMNPSISILKGWIGLFVIILFLASCQDNPATYISPTTRQFTPGPISVSSGITNVKLSWDKPAYIAGDLEASYTVIVSKDSLFQTDTLIVARTDTAGITFTEDSLNARVEYFAKVRTNQFKGHDASNWTLSQGFSIRGLQLFKPIYQPDVNATGLKLRWIKIPSINSELKFIRFQELSSKLNPKPVGEPIKVNLASQDLQHGYKTVNEILKSNTPYKAILFQAKNNGQGLRNVGSVIFTTAHKLNFTKILNPGANLGIAIKNSANGAVIGLRPGTYTLGSTAKIIKKNITIASTSGKPANTKLKVEEFVLIGNGAGIRLKDLDINMGGSDWLFDLQKYQGKDKVHLKYIVIDHSWVHNTGGTLVNGNRGNIKIDSIRISHSMLYNSKGVTDYFKIKGMKFKSIKILNSTIYNVGKRFFSWWDNLENWDVTPTILFDHCTINSFASGGAAYLFIDGRDNPMNLTIRNSIIANPVEPGETLKSTVLLRANDSKGKIKVTNNNFFNMTDGRGDQLEFPDYTIMGLNKHIDLGWDAHTKDFSLPTNTILRNFSIAGGPVGDPRWTIENFNRYKNINVNEIFSDE